MPRRRSRWADQLDVNELFLKLPPAEARELFERVHAAAKVSQVTYDDDEGVTHVVPIMIRPRLMRLEQEAYYQRVCLDLNKAIERIASLYLHEPQISELLPFTEREDIWLRETLAQVGDQPQTVIARLDANADFADDEWDGQFHFFETNTVGVGGMYYAPKVDEILMEHVVPAIQRFAPGLVMRPPSDMRQLLLDQLAEHAKAIKRPRCNVAFIQETGLIGGPNEFPFLVEYLVSRGVTAVICDPRELDVRDGELVCGDLPIDVAYRGDELAMLVELEAQGGELRGLRHAFSNNQVVSSFAGELDHKSTFEILTTPELASRFTQRQQRIFKNHVLWTRRVRETRTTDPEGVEIDLVPWLRRHKDRLVLKPNRSFGGWGIVVGPHVDLAQWDDALASALSESSAETGGVVAQQYVDVRVKDFPTLAEDGSIGLEEFYVVCGFLATPRGIGVLGRASKKRIVNVGQKGGLTGLVVVP
ncbi:MAG: hypothetical protein H0T46_03710 [Deltaproteobacteria bacterium]|nr:hypothetical protein [Deltaproteobacteria bacterium]